MEYLMKSSTVTKNYNLPHNIGATDRRSPDQKALHYMAAYGANSLTIAKHFGMRMDTQKAEELYSSMMSADFSKLDQKVLAEMQTNPCNEIFLDTESKTCTLFKEKPMKQSLAINRPVLIGTTDILTAQSFELDAIIREAHTQINNNEDLCAVSEYHKQEKVRLEEVISLCVEQLDKGLKTKESLVS